MTEANTQTESGNDLQQISAQLLEIGQRITGMDSRQSRLEQRVDNQLTQQSQQAGQAEKPQRYTRQQLNTAVTNCTITQEDADNIWDQQVQAEIDEKIAAGVAQGIAENSVASKVTEGLARYKAAYPSLDDANSEEFTKVQAKFDQMVNHFGMPKNAGTELAALEATFGPVEKKAPRKGREIIQSFDESVGASGGTKGGDKQADPSASITGRRKAFYEGEIGKGIYSGWDDPKLKAELDYIEGRGAYKGDA